jgi:ectoine hydroxylase-related dioxygenase (phytanoyl-CoA dioxygenase family)
VYKTLTVMTKIFFDESLDTQFKDDGVVTLPILCGEDIELLASTYAREHDIKRDIFHSTMFIDDPQYRSEIDKRIRAVMTPKINSLLIDYRLLFGNYIVKQSSTESAVGIHQDWNFTTPEFTSLNIWIPLVDIDEHTGTFYAFKGSHKIFHNIRYTPYADHAYAEIEDIILSRSTPFHLKAGEAVIYNGAIVHYSKPNVSSQPRIAIGMALIPNAAPNLHYYKRSLENILEVFEVDESFYNSFNFFDEPKGVRKISEIKEYQGLPSRQDLQ